MLEFIRYQDDRLQAEEQDLGRPGPADGEDSRHPQGLVPVIV